MALSETQRNENELKKRKVEVKMSSYMTVEGAVLLLFSLTVSVRVLSVG